MHNAKEESIDGNDTTTVLRYFRFHHQDRLGSIDRLLPARCRVCVYVQVLSFELSPRAAGVDNWMDPLIEWDSIEAIISQYTGV